MFSTRSKRTVDTEQMSDKMSCVTITTEEIMPNYLEEITQSNTDTKVLLMKLNDNLEKLVAMNADMITQQQKASIAASEKRGDDKSTKKLSGKTRDPPLGNEEEEDEHALTRTTVRLDGLEVYAIVSALTCAIFYQCLESFDSCDWGTLYSDKKYVELATNALFLVTSATGIMAGLHSTLIFSLMTMYGRTAVGMGRDDIFASFFKKTGGVRFHGFQTFLLSLYSLLIQVAILISSKIPTLVVAVFLPTFMYAMSRVYKDAQSIIKTAGIMFAPPKPVKTKKNGVKTKKQI